MAALPDGAFTDVKVFVVAIDGDGVRGIGLQLDGIGPAFFGSLESLRLVQTLMVVGRHLCHDVNRIPTADLRPAISIIRSITL